MDVATDIIPSEPFPSSFPLLGSEHTASTITEPEPGPGPGPLAESEMLSYDDTISYENQVPVSTELDPRSTSTFGENSLRGRISNAKVYLLEETSIAARNSISHKRKRGRDEDEDDDDDEIHFDHSKRFNSSLNNANSDDDSEMQEDLDTTHRPNAILLTGTPISYLPTSRLFAYTKHFDITPLGLEWVNDTTCIFVFHSRKEARNAFKGLMKSSSSSSGTLNTNTITHGGEGVGMQIEREEGEEEMVIAKPIPIAIWTPEERIANSLTISSPSSSSFQHHSSSSHTHSTTSTSTSTLTTSTPLKGILKMRWAKYEDIKKKGAKYESMFYKKHGEEAGKEFFEGGRDLPPTRLRPNKRLRSDLNDRLGDREMEKERLDEELELFLQQSDNENDGDNGGDNEEEGIEGGDEKEEDGEDEDDDNLIQEPISKMRSDYISNDGRTLLNHRNANGNGNGLPTLAGRLGVPLRRERGGRNRRRRSREPSSATATGRGGGSGGLWERLSTGVDQVDDTMSMDLDVNENTNTNGGRDRRRRRGGRRRNGNGREGQGEAASNEGRGGRRRGERPRKTQQELDDELEAFLKGA